MHHRLSQPGDGGQQNITASDTIKRGEVLYAQKPIRSTQTEGG